MRGRDVLTAVLGLAVVGGVVWGAWWLLGEEATPDEPVDEAAVLAERYLDAWEDGDLDTMAGLIDEAPPDFAATHQQLEAALGPHVLRVAGSAPDHEVDGRAVVDVDVELDTELMDEPATWRTELLLLRNRGQWAVEWSPATIHPELRSTSTFGVEREEVDRQPILAADGTPLAGTGEQVTFGFQPALVEDADDVVEAFEAALPGSGEDARRELGRDNLNPAWFYPVVTVSASRADAASARLREAAGILRRTEGSARVLHDDDFARHLVGIVAEATAEQLEELGDGFEPGHVLGQFGLEAAFEDRLTGSERVRIGIREGETGPLRVVIAEGQQDPSEPLQTTIDVATQQAVENTLRGIGTPAAIVVVDGADGAVLATASRPLTSFDRAWSGRYPPGSTFKIVTAEAALAAGATLEDPVDCPAQAIVGGLSVTNAGGLDLGEVTLAEAFAASCNTTFARLAADLGAEALQEAAQRFGFDAPNDLPLGAFLGSFPAPADTAEVAAAGFGQARVEASPLQLASLAAAVTGGAWHPPWVLTHEGAGAPRPLADGTAEPLRELLELAVTAGTGDAAAVEGQTVAGKTGTAQGTGGVEHAWFVGTWEGLGFAVLVEAGGSGGDVAAPLAGRLVRELSILLEEEP